MDFLIASLLLVLTIFWTTLMCLCMNLKPSEFLSMNFVLFNKIWAVCSFPHYIFSGFWLAFSWHFFFPFWLSWFLLLDLVQFFRVGVDWLRMVSISHKHVSLNYSEFKHSYIPFLRIYKWSKLILWDKKYFSKRSPPVFNLLLYKDPQRQ